MVFIPLGDRIAATMSSCSNTFSTVSSGGSSTASPDTKA